MRPSFKLQPVCLLALACLVSCASSRGAKSLGEALAGIPAKNLASYGFLPSTALVDRVLPAPEFLLDYLRNMDKVSNYTIYMPSREGIDEVWRNLQLLPSAYTSTLQDRLIGIYFINNWIGSGMADYVLDSDGKVYAILIINPETMRHDISGWLTYRESTSFLRTTSADKDTEVVINCGSAYTGLTYLLLHETSHIMDYVNHFTPYTEDELRQLGLAVSRTDFVDGVWDSYDRPFPAADYEGRQDLVFYGLGKPPSLHASQAADLYSRLAQTPFASLYGSRNWAEDFAEYFTWYFLTTVLHQPYSIQVLQGGRSVFIYEPMESELVRARASLFAAVLD